MQSALQKNVIASVLASQQRPAGVPWQFRLLARISILRDLPAKLIAFGPRRVRLHER